MSSATADAASDNIIEVIYYRLQMEIDFGPSTATEYFLKWLRNEGGREIQEITDNLYDEAASEGFEDGVEYGKYQARKEMKEKKGNDNNDKKTLITASEMMVAPKGDASR